MTPGPREVRAHSILTPTSRISGIPAPRLSSELEHAQRGRWSVGRGWEVLAAGIVAGQGDQADHACRDEGADRYRDRDPHQDDAGAELAAAGQVAAAVGQVVAGLAGQGQA